jgi:hypothetical protein
LAGSARPDVVPEVEVATGRVRVAGACLGAALLVLGGGVAELVMVDPGAGEVRLLPRCSRSGSAPPVGPRRLVVLKTSTEGRHYRNAGARQERAVVLGALSNVVRFDDLADADPGRCSHAIVEVNPPVPPTGKHKPVVMGKRAWRTGRCRLRVRTEGAGARCVWSPPTAWPGRARGRIPRRGAGR